MHENSIQDKIRFFTNLSQAQPPFRPLAKETSPQPLITNFIFNFLNKKDQKMTEEQHLVYKIADRIYTIEQCWLSCTISEVRNNINEVVRYLDSNFNNYIVFRFGKDKKTFSFKNFAIFEEPEFQFTFCINLIKAIKGWLSVNLENVVVIEKCGNKLKMAYLLVCIRKYFSNEKVSSIFSNQDFINQETFKLGNTLRKNCSNTLKRHCETFEKILNENLNQNILFFVQIIFGKETFEQGDYLLHIFHDNNKICVYPFITDQYFVIFNLNHLKIFNDTKLILFFDQKIILEHSFNTIHYNNGIYRINQPDLDFCKSEMFVDFVFKQSLERRVYQLEDTFIENVQVLCDHMIFKYRVEDLNLLSERYNRVLSRFALLQGFTMDQCEKYIREVSERENRNLDVKEMSGIIKEEDLILPRQVEVPEHSTQHISPLPNSPLLISPLFSRTINSTTLNSTTLHSSTNHHSNKQEIQTQENIRQKNLREENLRQEKYNSETNYDWTSYKLETLETLPDKVIEENVIKLKPRKPPKIKKKPEETPKVFVRRPLHLTTISSSSTIFNDLQELEVNFDTNKFEQWFCDPLNKPPKNEILEIESKIDRKKLFLAQLACKNLEKKGFDYKQIQFLIYKDFFKLEIEDLKNLEKLFFKKEEIEIEPTNELEQLIVKYSQTNIKKIIEILLFDRILNEEVLIFNRILESYLKIFKDLLENEVLKRILKLTLELTNAINYKYTINRKKVINFRMSCLKDLHNYKGKLKNQNLFLFLIESLKSDEEILFAIVNFTDTHSLLDVELKELKQRINYLIVEHCNCIKKIHLVEESDLKVYIKKSLGFGFNVLKKLKNLYLSVEEESYKVQHKFCDAKEESINQVIKDLCDFFKELKKEIEKSK